MLQLKKPGPRHSSAEPTPRNWEAAESRENQEKGRSTRVTGIYGRSRVNKETARTARSGDPCGSNASSRVGNACPFELQKVHVDLRRESRTRLTLARVTLSFLLLKQAGRAATV